MRVLDRIEAIKSRAQALNLTLHAVCQQAGSDYSLLHKWTYGVKGHRCVPSSRTAERELELLEEKLAELEAEMLERLAKRGGEAAAEPAYAEASARRARP